MWLCEDGSFVCNGKSDPLEKAVGHRTFRTADSQIGFRVVIYMK